MKNVHYLCLEQAGKDIDSFINDLQEKGIANIIKSVGEHEEIHIYYDRIQHGRFSNSLAFCFGYLRQVIVKDPNTNEHLFYIDYKPNMNCETKRLAINRFFNPEEVRNAVRYRNYVIPVMRLDCSIEDYELLDEKGKISLRLSIQNSKIVEAENLTGKTLKFVSLKDKTVVDLGYKIAKTSEKEINTAFESFQKSMMEHNQVFSKYRAVMELIYQSEIEKESAPF